MTTQANNDRGTFVQRVSVEFEVRIDAGVGPDDFGGITTADLQAATERYIRERLGDMAASAAEVYARRGPGGHRYFYPSEDVQVTATLPFRVSLADLLRETAAPTAQGWDHSDEDSVNGTVPA